MNWMKIIKPFYETLEVFDKLSYDRKRFNKFG